jgi:hypothetical protein
MHPWSPLACAFLLLNHGMDVWFAGVGGLRGPVSWRVLWWKVLEGSQLFPHTRTQPPTHTPCNHDLDSHSSDAYSYLSLQLGF